MSGWCEDVLNAVNGFSKKKDGSHKVNRNEIVIYGGFPFNPKDINHPKDPNTIPSTLTAAQYMTAAQLKSNGYAPTENFAPTVTANILFPGEDSELYFNVMEIPNS